MANNSGKSPFVDCASEIRNVIYGYVLSYDNPITRGTPDKVTSASLALLQVSKLVEREAAPIFYERNRFQFDCQNWETSSENDLHVYNEMRAKKGLSSYDDAQMTCPVIDMPKRHINSLRKVNLIWQLSGDWHVFWPIEPFFDNHLGPEILSLENPINFLAARNAILNSLSIILKRTDPPGIIKWEPDPSRLLRELDVDRRISTAVGKLVNLERLEIWKSRLTPEWPRTLKVPYQWTAVEPEALNRVKLDHFPKAKEILYTRRATERTHHSRMVFCIAEEFLIDFHRTGVNGRNLEYPSKLERLGLDGSNDAVRLRLRTS